MNSKLLNKRGSILDILILIVVVFGLSIILLIGSKISTEMNKSLQQNPMMTNNSKTMLQESVDRFVPLFDGVFITVLVFLFLAIIIGAYYVDTHPAIFIFSIILMGIFVMLAGIFANVYDTAANSTELSVEAAKFTFIPAIMHNFVIVITIMGFVVLIVLYSKMRSA